MTIKSNLKKFWAFLWDDNSALSWIVVLIIAFILIKFVVFPGAGWLLGTDLPVVAVISHSMEHPAGDKWIESSAYCSTGPCTQEAWYLENNISYAEFEKFPFKHGFNKGDIMILIGKAPDEIVKGDVIVFNSRKDYPIIHRVVNVYEEYGVLFFATKGDNNALQLVDAEINEKRIPASQIRGVAALRIPLLGYLRIWVTDIVTDIRGIF